MNLRSRFNRVRPLLISAVFIATIILSAGAGTKWN